MKLATYADNNGGAGHVGLILGERVVPLTEGPGAPADMAAIIAAGEPALEAARGIAAKHAGDAAAGVELSGVRLLAPIPRPARNIVCVGLNYADHVAESASVVGADLPKFPVFFSKPPSTVIGPGDDIPWHPTVSTMIDWEAELAVIIGREGRDIREADAMGYVFGYTCANDVTARDLQGRHQQWYKGKGLDGFCPLGPQIVTADEIADAHALDIRLAVNGVEKQHSNTKHLIFRIPRLIAEWSAGMTLYPGDVLLTGTPSGVGVGRKPPEWLKPGDDVEVQIEGIGTLRNTVGA